MAMAMDITYIKLEENITKMYVRMTSEKLAFSSFKIIFKGKAKI